MRDTVLMNIDPTGGMAGDMFAAALISAGADPEVMIRCMRAAAEKLGRASIVTSKSSDGASRLTIELESSRHHLSEAEATDHLEQLFLEFQIEDTYRDFGFRILEILVRAEKKAHRAFNIIVDDPHHSHDKNHPHPETITFLHEAQDIIVDIMGAACGLQLLNTQPRATLLKPVSVGGGMIHFSHGSHQVPAPATRVILEDHRISWKQGPIQRELCTPTGASILAALSPIAKKPPP